MSNMLAVNNPLAGLAGFQKSGAVAARPSSNAVAQSDQAKAIAEVQAAMVIARQNPRDQIEAMDRILIACQRPTLADQAVYSYSRGGSDISGPSIRLAEALAQNWGNIQFGIRELEQSGGASVVQAFAWDVETNVKREMVFTVPHVRHTKKGAYRLEDPRDIYEMVANNGARRLRACILGVIPGDVTEAAVAQCEETMRAKADTSPEAMAKMLAAFDAFGVSREQIEARIQRRIDAIQPAQIVALKKIYASLRDGMSKPADWFDVIDVEQGNPAPANGNDSAKAALRQRAKSHQDQPSDAAPLHGATAESPINQAAGSEAAAEYDEDGVVIDDDPRAERVTEIITSLTSATTIVDLNSRLSKWGRDIDALPDDMQAEIHGAAEARRTELTGK